MKDKISNTNRDVVNGANKSKDNCNLISDGHEKSIPDQSYTQIVDRHEMIYLSKKYNFEKCLLPVKSGINIDFFKFIMLTDYEDKEICRFLEYGFPLGIDYANPDLDLILKDYRSPKEIATVTNHMGAVNFPSDIDKYLIKELQKSAIAGPFHVNPFSHGIVLSPLNSVPKRESTDRRIILDLSSEGGSGVNSFVSKDEYLGQEVNLTYPRVDDFVDLIKKKGKGCFLFKRDLSRAYR
jgi:hypothetical protein